MTKTGCNNMSRILIKMPMKPHRQKVLTPDGQEVRLQQFANRMAANELRGAGGDAQGEQFTSSRDKLMRDIVANPEAHNIKFMGERVPFEGQTLGESLSMPDVAGEQAAIDSEFAGEEEGKSGKDMEEILAEEDADEEFKTGERGSDNSVQRDRTDTFNPDKEAEHLRRIMTSRNVIMRDAWSVLKNMPTSYPEPYTPQLTPQERAMQKTPQELERERQERMLEAMYRMPPNQ
jgi:hypothetical protein